MSTSMADPALATASRTVALPEIEQPTRLSPEVVVNRAGRLRSTVGVLATNVVEVHGQSLLVQLKARTEEAAKRSPIDLLGELSAAGFSWSAIARLVGVSVPAIRKWRQGESVAPENRLRLARLVAFVAVVVSDYLISDVASWIEIPIEDSGLTGLDVLVAERYPDLVEFAANHITGGELLDRVFPEWRSSIDDRFEVADDADGERYIRMKAGSVEP